jgi:hypothetical protein
MVQMIRITIISMFKNNSATNIWGFKEIRYDSGNIEYIRSFKELFPQTKVIIQIRENIDAQSKSSWHKDDKNAKVFLIKTTRELIEFGEKNKEYCFLTSFERMFDKNNMQNLFSFMDCRENYNEEKIQYVLNNNIKD